MKFSEMPYERIDKEEISKTVKEFTKRLKGATSFEEAKKVFEEFDVYDRHIDTNYTIAYIRHDIDTNDKFYDTEIDYWNETMPALEAEWQEWKDALLESPFRKDLEKEYGDIIFVNAELDKKSFTPEMIPELQQEAKLSTEYGKLIASAQIPFEGGVYTLSQLTPFKTDADDARREAAWKAEGAWYKEHKEK